MKIKDIIFTSLIVASFALSAIVALNNEARIVALNNELDKLAYQQYQDHSDIDLHEKLARSAFSAGWDAQKDAQKEEEAGGIEVPEGWVEVPEDQEQRKIFMSKADRDYLEKKFNP